MKTVITDFWKSDSCCLRLKVKFRHWQQLFLISRKLARKKFNEKLQNLDSYSKNGKQSKNVQMHKARFQYVQHVIKLVKRHHEPPVLLYFGGFPGWLAWFSLQILCLNNKIHFSLANANNSASFKRKMVWKWRFLLIHKQQSNFWIKPPTIPPGLADKIVKYRLPSGPIR